VTSFLTNRKEAENSRFLTVMEMKSLTKKKEDNMSSNPNFRHQKNGNHVQGTGGNTGGANAGGNAGGNLVKKKLSPMEKKLIDAENKIRRKLYAKYGELLKLLSPPELMEIIRLNFGDDPIRAVLEETDNSIGAALRCMYGEPISRRSY